MSFTAGQFRTQFPEFKDTVVYPDQQIDFWATFAKKQLPQATWCDQWDAGVSLYVAHEITLAAQSVKAASAGGVPGVSGGVAITKTVGSVTVGYDAQTTSEKDAGYWNLTNYGKQLYRLIRLFGAQCIQL
jgi:hypothetical protein